MLLRHEAFTGLCRARELLGEVREDVLSIQDVAREIRMSPYHFIRQFEALFELTPHQFRIQSRLDEAKRLLALGRHSVMEVGMEVGMSSLCSFSDLFARDAIRVPTAAAGSLSRMSQPYGPSPGFCVSQFSRSARGGCSHRI